LVNDEMKVKHTNPEVEVGTVGARGSGGMVLGLEVAPGADDEGGGDATVLGDAGSIFTAGGELSPLKSKTHN